MTPRNRRHSDAGLRNLLKVRKHFFAVPMPPSLDTYDRSTILTIMLQLSGCILTSCRVQAHDERTKVRARQHSNLLNMVTLKYSA